MRFIGLDIGQARTGLSVSDELALTARPLMVVPTKQLTGVLAEQSAALGVDQFVVGRPRHLGGELGQQAAAIDAVVTKLRQAVSGTYHYEDETATTLAGGSDDAAAAVMLQGFLEERQR